MRFCVNCAFSHLGKRGAASRKSAFCLWPLTEKRTLYVGSHGKVHSACERSRRLRLSVTVGPRGCPDCAFPSRRDHRVRLYVSVRGQNALFRKVRFFSPGQTRRRLTEKRILQPAGHGKAHSVRRISRKSAFCVWSLTEKHTLHTRLTKRRTLQASGRALCIDADTQPRDSRFTVPQALRPEVHV